MIQDNLDSLSSQSQQITMIITDSPPLIDLTQSPRPSLRDSPFEQADSFHNALPQYEQEYKCFNEKLSMVQLPTQINLNQSKSELKKERIKFLLHDWILWTSSHSEPTAHAKLDRSLLTNVSFFQEAAIDSDDLDIFKGYVLYLAAKKRNFEMVLYIIKIFKRLIKKYGSFEWVNSFREISSSIQSEFYEQYDSVLDLD